MPAPGKPGCSRTPRLPGRQIPRSGPSQSRCNTQMKKPSIPVRLGTDRAPRGPASHALGQGRLGPHHPEIRLPLQKCLGSGPGFRRDGWCRWNRPDARPRLEVAGGAVQNGALGIQQLPAAGLGPGSCSGYPAFCAGYPGRCTAHRPAPGPPGETRGWALRRRCTPLPRSQGPSGRQRCGSAPPAWG